MRILCAWFPKLDIDLALRQRPALASRPVVLLQGHGDRAIVSGASCEAARLGILAGMSAGQARRRSPAAVFLADNAGACLDELERIARIVRARVTERVGVGGRDHLFVAIEGDSPEDEKALALRVMSLVRAWADRPVRGGLAPSRQEALEAARASRRGLLVAPPAGAGAPPETIPPFRTPGLAARLQTGPLAGLAARAAVAALLCRLEAVLAARGEGARALRVEVTVPGGVVEARATPAQPFYSGAEAMQLVAADLVPEALEGATAVGAVLGRLAPDVRVRPLGATNFEPQSLALAG
jgi:nucleotidyltransferase/DNA polymerase involved in DNA repair